MGSVDAGSIVGEGSVRCTAPRSTARCTGYANVGGKPVAIAPQARRASAATSSGRSASATRTVNQIRGTRSFMDAFATSPFTFNVGYADDRDIAIFSAGRAPAAATSASTRACRPAARANTSGTASCPTSKLPAAGQLVPRGAAQLEQQAGAADLPRPTTTGATARCTASRCSRPASPRKPTHDLASVTAR